MRFLFVLLLSFPVYAEELKGKVIGIIDGDTVTLRVGPHRYRVRLVEIDTPDQGQPWGNKARQALSRKILKRTVRVETEGSDRYGRMLGRIYLRDRDINREMVAEGHAWVYRQYMTDESLLADEASAKKSGLGLWALSEPPVPSWGTVQDPGQAMHCGAKQYCREMTSCQEAKFYLKECGLTRLDGDGNGIPCESICR